MKNLKMYIIVNKELNMSPEKMSAQVGHAVNVLTYKMAQNNKELLDEYMNGEIKKIVLYANQSKLEQLEQEGYIAIRDKGYTEIEPNSLTCVTIGILDGDNIPVEYKWVKRLKTRKE